MNVPNKSEKSFAQIFKGVVFLVVFEVLSSPSRRTFLEQHVLGSIIFKSRVWPNSQSKAALGFLFYLH